MKWTEIRVEPSTFHKQLKKDPSTDENEIVSVSLRAEGKKIIRPIKTEKTTNKFICKIQININTTPSSHCAPRRLKVACLVVEFWEV